MTSTQLRKPSRIATLIAARAQAFSTWKSECRKQDGNCTFEGDLDYCVATSRKVIASGRGVAGDIGEWDGNRALVFDGVSIAFQSVL